MSVLKIRDEKGNIVEIPALKGDKGDSYILTQADKSEIADIVKSDFINVAEVGQ